MKWKIFTLFLCLGFGQCFAQENDEYTKGLVQFSGIIVNLDSANLTVPYVTIQDKSRNISDLSNYQGYFSFVVNEGDTIRFTSIGFDPYEIIIPKNVKDHKYTIKIGLKPNVTDLPAFNVFPWATIEEFNHDFLTMKFSDDEEEAARQNLNRRSFQELARNTPTDGRVSMAQRVNALHDQMDNRNKMPTTNFLSPIAWAKFINQISNSDKKKK